MLAEQRDELIKSFHKDLTHQTNLMKEEIRKVKSSLTSIKERATRTEEKLLALEKPSKYINHGH